MSTDGSPGPAPTPPPPIEFEPNQPAPAPTPPVDYAPPPPLPPEPAPSPSVPFSVRESAKQMGYDAATVDRFESDEAFFGGIMNALGTAGEDRQYADIGRQVAPRWDEVQQMLTGPAADAPPPAPAEPEADAWPSCERNPAYDKLPRDAQGNYLYNDITEAKLASQANAGRTLRRERLDAIANDPMEQIRRAGLDKYLDERDERMRSEYRGEFESRDVASVQQAHLQEHLTEYCQADAQGNLAYDRGNNLVLTPKGQAYQHYLSQGQEHWKIPAAQAHEYAVRQVEADTALGAFGPAQPGQTPATQAQPGQAPPAAPPNAASPAQVGQQNRDSFLDQAQAGLQQAAPGTPPANRNGTFPGSDALAPLQNSDASINDLANEVLTQAGRPTQ